MLLPLNHNITGLSYSRRYDQVDVLACRTEITAFSSAFQCFMRKVREGLVRESVRFTATGLTARRWFTATCSMLSVPARTFHNYQLACILSKLCSYRQFRTTLHPGDDSRSVPGETSLKCFQLPGPPYFLIKHWKARDRPLCSWITYFSTYDKLTFRLLSIPFAWLFIYTVTKVILHDWYKL